MSIHIGPYPHVTWSIAFSGNLLDVFKARMILDAKSIE